MKFNKKTMFFLLTVFGSIHAEQIPTNQELVAEVKNFSKDVYHALKEGKHPKKEIFEGVKEFSKEVGRAIVKNNPKTMVGLKFGLPIIAIGFIGTHVYNKNTEDQPNLIKPTKKDKIKLSDLSYKKIEKTAKPLTFIEKMNWYVENNPTDKPNQHQPYVLWYMDNLIHNFIKHGVAEPTLAIADVYNNPSSSTIFNTVTNPVIATSLSAILFTSGYYIYIQKTNTKKEIDNEIK